MATSSASAGPDTRHSRFSRSSLRRSVDKQLPSYLFILPALILYVIFVLIPFFNTIYYSMTDWDGAQPVKNFVGLANFSRMFQDRLMWVSLSHNLIWIAVGTLTPVVFALVTATLVSGGMRGRVVFRTIYFMPVVLAQVVVAMVWAWIYHPLFGPINTVLEGDRSGPFGAWLAGRPPSGAVCAAICSVLGLLGFLFCDSAGRFAKRGYGTSRRRQDRRRHRCPALYDTSPFPSWRRCLLCSPPTP